tara:strand:- start:37 stop:279 length:243 start_codon:yes stop_codon:yes gene_type:complete
MTYVTDYKWKPFKSDMSGYGFKYKGIHYELSDFTRFHWSETERLKAPITFHGIYHGSAFHFVGIEIDEETEMYRVAMIKS